MTSIGPDKKTHHSIHGVVAQGKRQIVSFFGPRGSLMLARNAPKPENHIFRVGQTKFAVFRPLSAREDRQWGRCRSPTQAHNDNTGGSSALAAATGGRMQLMGIAAGGCHRLGDWCIRMRLDDCQRQTYTEVVDQGDSQASP